MYSVIFYVSSCIIAHHYLWAYKFWCDCNVEFYTKKWILMRTKHPRTRFSHECVSRYLFLSRFSLNSHRYKEGQRVSYFIHGRDIINPATVYGIVINNAFLLPVPGLFPKKYTEADRVQVLEGRQVSSHQIKSESLPVLQIQEVLSRRHV